MVPIAAWPIRIPLPIASRALIPGFLRTTSVIPLVISTLRSIIAPEAPINMLAIKMRVKSSDS